MEPMGEDTRRDARWFEAIFVEYGNKVLAYATRRCPGDADDVVAEVFATAWKYRSNVPAEPLPWLYRTAAHQIQHSHRGRTRRAALASRSARMNEPERDPTDLADGVVAQVDRETAVARVMAGLPPRDREVLRLWAWEQLSTDEIAYVLVISSAAARVRLHRARRRAEALLQQNPSPARLPQALRSVEELR